MLTSHLTRAKLTMKNTQYNHNNLQQIKMWVFKACNELVEIEQYYIVFYSPD